ncbi:TetR/AcrR family transcriptional regulator [Paenibacillus sp. R14(2021)]|uniref:TetR/AcrR family transcriptional regulator n=1 Tax=Paenibacillus sp. R14(2021) TaxID=2859228 RepID=UPI0021576F3A|nr:TetR/AcrR family transcriptional regulator [Paenibacillus sp. R14(2021)]
MSNAMSVETDPKTKLLKKLISTVMNDGFQQLKMDDIAKVMSVSRATLYKNFSSKEEVIAGVVHVFIDYIERLDERVSEEEEESFGIWYQQLFEQSIMLVGRITDVFLAELQSVYPALYDQLKDTLTKREQQILDFYRDGENKGVFNAINAKFLLVQDNLVLREIITTKYLVVNQMTIQQVLWDYYQLKKIQLFKANKLSIVDDAKIGPAIDHFVDKFNRAL